jgi:diguanylate cyclase (GGDEF)-like protein
MVDKTDDTGTIKVQPGSPSWNLFGRVFQTIRFRVLGLVVVSVLIPSILAGMLAIRYLDSIIKDQILQNLSGRAESLSGNISRWLTDRTSDVSAFTSSYLLTEEAEIILSGDANEKKRDQSRSAVNKYLSYLLEDNKLFRGFSVLSEGGNIIATQPVDDGPFMDNIEILDKLETEPQLLETETSDGPRIMVVQRLTSGLSQSNSYFLGELRSEQVRKITEENLPPYSSAYIVDNKGNLKVLPVPDPTSSIPTKEVFRLVRSKVNFLSYTGVSGEPSIGASYPIEHLSWNLIVETSRKQAYVPLSTFRNQLIVMTILLASLLLIPAIYLARTIIIPLEELSHTSKRIRSGEAGLEIPVRAGGELGELVSAFNSMSLSLKQSMEEIQAINSQLRVMSVTDPLTGMYNRRYIVDHLDRELKQSKRTNQPLSLIMADLDNFKNYNDRHGHIAGDEALKELGGLLAYSIRETDVVARYGGEEFLIFLNHTDKDGAVKTAEKLRLAVEERIFDLKGEKTRITISLGISSSPEDGTSFDELVDAADRALYHAKDMGRNKVSAADPNEPTP